MPGRKKAPSTITKFIAIGIPLVTFAAGALLNGFNLAQSVAKKEDVKEVLKITTDYTDARTKDVFQRATEYTDAKNQQIMLKMEEMKTEVKATEMGLTVQVQALTKSIEELRSDLKTQDSGRGHRR